MRNKEVGRSEMFAKSTWLDLGTAHTKGRFDLGERIAGSWSRGRRASGDQEARCGEGTAARLVGG